MAAAAATVLSLYELQANANALSASAKTSPPWHRAWPLSMSGRTRITTVAAPGRTSVRRMPSACEARSQRNSSAAASSARRCGSAGVAGGSCMMSFLNSASGELRRALRGERRHALGVVSAVTEFALVVALHVQLLRQRAAEALVDRLLGARQSAGRCRRKVARELIDGRGQLGVVHAAPDQPPGGRLFGAQFFPQQGQAERARRAD